MRRSVDRKEQIARATGVDVHHSPGGSPACSRRVFSTPLRAVPQHARFLVSPPENSYINAAAERSRFSRWPSLGFCGRGYHWQRALRFDPQFLNSPFARRNGKRIVPVLVARRSLIGFFTSRSYASRSFLKKIDVSGGPPITIASAIAGNRGTSEPQRRDCVWNGCDAIAISGLGGRR